jgi:outer membrane receptor protein involved in Fe transport
MEQVSEEGPSSPRLEEIVVTARKREETIQSIPETVTALSREAINEAHITRPDDIGILVSNLNIVTRADNTPDVVLRGVGSFGVIQGVGFYVDDVQQFEGQTIRPEDVERIEVLKGPQGTLFGGANIGGAIKYVSRAPTSSLTAEGQVEVGNLNSRTYEGIVSGPVMGDSLKGRLSLFNTSDDGFIYDPFLRRTLGEMSERGGRMTLEYDRTPLRVVFYLTGNILRGQSENLYYTPPNDHTYLRTVDDGTVPSFDRRLYSPTLKIEADFSRMTLTSLTSYFHSHIDSLTDLDKRPVPFLDFGQGFTKAVWSQELRLTSNGESSLRWIIGAFAQQIDTDSAQIAYAGLASLGPAPPGPVTTIVGVTPLTNTHRQQDVSAYGNIGYSVGPWTGELGLRADHYNMKMNDTTGLCNPCSGAVRGTELMPRVSLSYRTSEQVVAYSTLSRGFEPGDLVDEPDENGVDIVHPFRPERATSVELGVKSTTFNNRLRLNVAGFYIDYSDRLYEASRFTSAGIVQVEQNIGTSHNYGIEVEAAAKLLPSLTLSTNLGYTRALWSSGAIFDPVTGAVVQLNGRYAPNVPAYQASVTGVWRKALTERLILGARIDANFVGKSYWDPQNYVQQRAYQVTNLGLRLEAGKHLEFGFNLLNAFDRRFNTNYGFGDEIGLPYNVAGINRPRQWFINVAARY